MNLSIAQNTLTPGSYRIQSHYSSHLASPLLVLAVLGGFGIFNYSATVFALSNLFGSPKITGINWASLLAVTICCLDISGIISILRSAGNPTLVDQNRRIFGAWLLIATSNTWITWHGISQAITSHQAQFGWIVDEVVLNKILPIFIVLLVWLVRVMVIGSLSQKESPRVLPDTMGNDLNILKENSGGRFPAVYTLPHDIPIPVSQFNPSKTYDGMNRKPTYKGVGVRYKYI